MYTPESEQAEKSQATKLVNDPGSNRVTFLRQHNAWTFGKKKQYTYTFVALS